MTDERLTDLPVWKGIADFAEQEPGCDFAQRTYRNMAADTWRDVVAALESRPTPEAVAAAVEAMRNAVPSCPLGVAGRLEDAIAGLTGGEVQHD